jgi:hypothetical protein|tara:strand:+ start:420 stop:1040 length:621 start_codon:yes stop_codon:yes gene_type:complete
MSKLNNVKAVNQMIRGEHRTQTQKTKGYEKKSIERQIGDSWVDKAGQEWVQKNGYKAKIGRFNEVRKSITTSNCPKCDKKATRFDKQFITREGMCHDCVVKQETLLMCEGHMKKEPIYEQWERKKIRDNAESFLEDAAKDVEMLKAKFTKSEYVNSDGTIDKWKIPESVESIEQSLDKQFDKFKEELLEKLDQGEKNVGIKITTSK